MTYDEERKEMINTAAKEAAKIDGYTVLRNNASNYFYIITPSDNVLAVFLDEFYGMYAVFEYIPSRSTGSGCRCNDERFTEITPELLQELERDGLKFAQELKAKLYSRSNAWFNNYWDSENLTTV